MVLEFISSLGSTLDRPSKKTARIAPNVLYMSLNKDVCTTSTSSVYGLSTARAVLDPVAAAPVSEADVSANTPLWGFTTNPYDYHSQEATTEAVCQDIRNTLAQSHDLRELYRPAPRITAARLAALAKPKALTALELATNAPCDLSDAPRYARCKASEFARRRARVEEARRAEERGRAAKAEALAAWRAEVRESAAHDYQAAEEAQRQSRLRGAQAAAAASDRAKRDVSAHASEAQRRRAAAQRLHSQQTSAFTCGGCPCAAPAAEPPAGRSPRARQAKPLAG